MAQSSGARADYKIVKLVNGINRPDLPCPPCTPFYIFYTPVISGDYVAFLSRNGPPDGVWSGNINTKALTKLVGLETPVPGGTGNFSAFFGAGETPLSIGGDTVLFFGADAANVFGLYSVPVTGGPVKRIATKNTTAPDGTKFGDLRRASTNGSKVVFYGNTPGHFTGIYQTSTSGKNLQTVIDSDTLLDARTPGDPPGTSDDYFGIYSAPVIGQKYINFYASGAFDPSVGANAIFQNKEGYLDIADNVTPLPGGTDDAHVRILAFSADPDSNAVAFRADEPANAFAGLFKVRNKDAANAFVTTDDLVPGTSRKFTSFGAIGYDMSGLAFNASYVSGGNTDQSVYFTAGPGQPVVKVASGKKYVLPLIGDRSISGGKIVFMDGSNFADTVYAAVPTVP